MKLHKRFVFDAAYQLTDYDGKCANIHGHTYVLEVVIMGKVAKDGMVVDFLNNNEKVEENILKKCDGTQKIIDNLKKINEKYS